MKNILLAFALACGLAGGAVASSGGVAWDRFPTDKTSDLAALQNGAKIFANYCLNCHSAAFTRYNRLRDIGLSEEQIKQNLMFATDKVGETMKVSMDPKSAKEWFGGVPPDLTLIARSRAAMGQGTGADYLYTFLRTFYRDDTKATGWNNMAFPNVGMPHVLWQLQGPRELRIVEVKEAKGPDGKAAGWEEVRTVHAADGSSTHESKPLAGHTGHASLSYDFVPKDAARSAQFDSDVGDLVAYLQWMGEPAAARRTQIGVWVLIFLGLFIVVAWRLNAAYWKDVK
jgi:ubiquinol-cytochrome c reductase cytochrome c1 subunit